MSFSIILNNLLFKIFYNNSYIWHVIAHFGKIFFMSPYIVKRRRRFVCPSVNQCMYTLTLKERGSTASKFVTEILERVFEKTWRLGRMILKNFLDFSLNYSFILRFIGFFFGSRGLSAPKFSL